MMIKPVALVQPGPQPSGRSLSNGYPVTNRRATKTVDAIGAAGFSADLEAAETPSHRFNALLT
jgi:hypothetical protein